jgi:hypothetical protein
MEEAWVAETLLQIGDEPDNNLISSQSLVSSSKTSKDPFLLPGNEENAPKNSLDDRQQQQGQPQILKKMRMSGTSKHGSRRFSGGEPPTSTDQNRNVDVERPMLYDPSTVLPAAMIVWPSLEQAPSSDSETEGSSCISTNSHNWLDDYGKLHNSNIGHQQIQPTSHTTQLHVPGKDPRFHCRRKTNQISCDRRSPLFPDDPMQAQVFLAPVIIPQAEASTGRSSWKEAHNEPTQELSSPLVKQPDVFEASHSSLATTHEAPGLAESSSLETSSSFHSGLTNSSTTSVASALVRRIVASKPSTTTTDTAKARLQRPPVMRSTPVRIKPRVKPQEVQATDQGYASVAKLSAWLEDDPTSTKKVRHVRRGANVIAKSRKFEKDLEDIIVEESKIVTGAVKEKKDWLKSAFRNHEADVHEDDYLHRDPNRHMMMMRTQPVNEDDCARSEFVVNNDAASSISVTGKKQWLQNAFKKGGSNTSQPRMSFKAQSDIGPMRESRDDITSRAKNMWKQKSEKRVPDARTVGAHTPAAAPSPYRTNQRPPIMRDTPPRKALEERMRSAVGPRVSAPAAMIAKAANSSQSVVGSVLDEDTTSVDFLAARQLLIQRSLQNGNELKVASKVQRRACQFERINKDTKRRLSATGLLKPTWESTSQDGNTERPPGAYTKTFAEDIAPKRSFEELP